MNIKIRVRNLQDAMVIGRAAAATGQSVEEMAKRALYKEVTSIYERINNVLAEKGKADGSQAGITEGNNAEISQAGNANSNPLANQEDTSSEVGAATGT